MSDHITIALEASASGDPYWHSPRMMHERDRICRQVAREYRDLEKEIERLRAELEIEIAYRNALLEKNERLREALDDAFLAGWDHYNASRSRMDMPRDRIKCLEYWKEKEALK